MVTDIQYLFSCRISLSVRDENWYGSVDFDWTLISTAEAEVARCDVALTESQLSDEVQASHCNGGSSVAHSTPDMFSCLPW